MKTTLIFLVSQVLLCGILPLSSVHAQKKALNIAGIHQLVADSKSEYNLQNNARDRQAVTTANEQANKIMLTRLKDKYRELQQRYHVIGTFIDAANIGIYATPMVNHIVQNQMEIYRIARQSPILISLAYKTEVEFVSKARSLINYLIALSVSFGVINQMKSSDRKILFDHIVQELSRIQLLSVNLVNSMQVMQVNGAIKSLNPFQNYVDQDKTLIKEIFTNASYLKK